MVDIGSGRGWLSDAAAQSLWRVDKRIGHPLQITEAGRTWEQQNEHYQRYLRYGTPIALRPGTSLHESGLAIDTDERLTPILNDHGWYHTVYRNGVLVEPWHYEYQATRDNHRGAAAGGTANPFPTEEEDMALDKEDLIAILNASFPNGTEADGKTTRYTSVSQALRAVYFYGDKLYAQNLALTAAVTAMAGATGADPTSINKIVQDAVRDAVGRIRVEMEE